MYGSQKRVPRLAVTACGPLVVSAILLALAALAFAAFPITIVVNGVELGPDCGGRMVDGQVMVPIRAVAEALGAEVRWVAEESRVYITTKGSTSIKPEKAPAAPNEEPTIVYVTKTGSKYHRAGCRYLPDSPTPLSLEDAKAQGYTPCGVCRPPE